MFRLISAELGGERVDVAQGEHVLGRGPFLNVTDKRVSRNHALLICTGEKLELVPKHKNPCFYREAGSGHFKVLAKDSTQLLQDGDQFSLLPKELIFKVEEIKAPTTEPPAADETVAPCAKLEELPADEGREGPEDSDIVTEQDSSVTAKTTDAEDKSDDGAAGMSSSKTRKLPSWLLAAAAGGGGAKKKEVKKPANKRAKSPEAIPDSKRTAVAKEDTAKPMATKKPELVSEDPLDPRSCDDEVIITDTATSDADKSTTGTFASSSTAVDTKLPPCPYGKKCYRKNPVHFKEYSHDFSDDVIDDDITDDESDKPACPYGTACYRKNPVHRKEYSHNAPPIADTAGDSTRTSTRSRRKAKVSALAGDSDDDGQPNTYDYTDSFIDDADKSSDQSTEYGDGESEDSDWAPGDREDVSELVDEAKDFMSNKKMHKPT